MNDSAPSAPHASAAHASAAHTPAPHTAAAPVTPAGRSSGSPATAVLKVETRLFLREFGSLFWIVAFPALLLAILGSIPGFREPDPGQGGLRTVDLYVPVSVLLALIVAGIQAMPPVLTGYRERGILRRVSTTPVRPRALLTAQVVLHGATALCSAALVLAVGRLAFAVRLPRQLPGYAVALLLATLVTLTLGAAISARARTTKATGVIGTVVFFPMMFCAGVWLPVQAMPGTLRDIVEVTPFGAASQALHEAAGGSWPSWTHLGMLALWSLVLARTARRSFRWE